MILTKEVFYDWRDQKFTYKEFGSRTIHFLNNKGIFFSDPADVDTTQKYLKELTKRVVSKLNSRQKITISKEKLIERALIKIKKGE